MYKFCFLLKWPFSILFSGFKKKWWKAISIKTENNEYVSNEIIFFRDDDVDKMSLDGK